MMVRILISVLALLSASSVGAATFAPIWARDGMVVTSVRPAAAAGAEVLRRGGNAVDAAVATAFAAAVAHPFSSGLGGGLFAVTFRAADGQTAALDAREAAPASASAQFYRDNPDAIRRGKHSVGVPGFVQGVAALHARYGSMPWAVLIEPAVQLAENGVAASVWHHQLLKRVAPRLADYPETARIQLHNGKPPELGWLMVQKDLAKTLRKIQREGATALAEGDMARAIEQATEGVVTVADVAGYKVHWREPVRGSYRDMEIVSMPPPSSGGVLLVEMLNMLEGRNLKELSFGSGPYVHYLAEVMRLAFADRARYLGDPDFSEVPVSRLTSKVYAANKAKQIKPDALVAIAGLEAPPDDAGTTHISVVDGAGNAVALTQTINSVFGSLITVPGTGIVLNNELDDFSIAPDIANEWLAVGSEINGVQPGKRPLSSMTPTLVLRDGQVMMVAGSPMGTTIISSVLQSLVNVIDFEMNPQQAVMAPRAHHQWQPDRLIVEPDFPAEVRTHLTGIGHNVVERPFMGAVQLIRFDPQDCYLWAGVDGRRDSGAAAVNLDQPTARRAGCMLARQP